MGAREPVQIAPSERESCKLFNFGHLSPITLDRYLTVSSLALVAAAVCEVNVPHYSSKALNAMVVTRDMNEFGDALRAIVALGLASSVFIFVRAAFFGLAGTRVATRARSMLLRSLLRQDMAFFDGRDTGELTNRLSADCAKFSSVVASHVNVLLRQAIQLVGGSVFLFRIDRGLALVTLVGIFLIGALTTLHGDFIRCMGRRSQDALARANSVSGQILSLIRVVRAHGSEERELERCVLGWVGLWDDRGERGRRLPVCVCCASMTQNVHQIGMNPPIFSFECLIASSTRPFPSLFRYGLELRNTVNMLETHDLGHSVYRSAVRLLQTLLQVKHKKPKSQRNE